MHTLSWPRLAAIKLLIVMTPVAVLAAAVGLAPDRSSPPVVAAPPAPVPVPADVKTRTETQRSLMGGFWQHSTVTTTQRKIALDEVQTGSLLLNTEEGGYYIEAARLDTEVAITVTGMLARVVVTQSFANPSEDWAEGLFAFPLPEDAAVDALRMKVGERVIEGQIMEKAQARKTYERAKREGNRASLVEQDRPNLFRTAVANIAPRDTVQVEISYLETLRYDAGRFSLRFPLTITPRFSPDQLSAGMLPSANPLTANLQRASTTPGPAAGYPAAAAAAPSLAQISVTLNAGFPLRNVESASHDIDVDKHGLLQQVALRDVAVPMDRDFQLEWEPSVGAEPGAAVFTEERNGETYALVMFMPPQDKVEEKRLPRETIIVIDTSGSMAGASFSQAQGAVEQALGMLSEDDYFNLIEFDNHFSTLFGSARPATPQNLADAREYLARLQADGGTNMAPALASALNAQNGTGLLRQVVFITDGAVDNERELFGLIERELGNSRLFTVGIGSAPNSFFMRKAAESGRGTYSYIGSVQEVGERMTALFRKLESPVLKDVKVNWPGAAPEVWPERTPDLYQREPLVLTAKLAELPRTLTIEGQQAGNAWRRELPLNRAENFRGVSTLWARSKVASLMDGLASGEAADIVRGRVLPLALEHLLVTRYTSLVAVDERPVRPLQASLHAKPIANMAPGGGQVPYPAGGTPALLQMMLGIASLLMGFMLWLARVGQ